MIALYHLNTQIGGGTISVPVALFTEFHRAIAALSIDDLRTPGETGRENPSPPTERQTP